MITHPRRAVVLPAIALVLLSLHACGKPEAVTDSSAETETEAPAAPVAADDTDETSAAAPQVEDSSEADAAAAERQAAIDFALAEQEIADDPDGQWASSATASSTYGDATEQASYAPWQATGAPNVEHFGDNGDAWAPAAADSGIEWLQVGFDTPVHAREIRIRQNSRPGAIIKLELVDAAGARTTVFQGIDPNTYPDNSFGWFKQRFEPSAEPVTGVKITLATNSVQGWNEIDAVQLVGTASP